MSTKITTILRGLPLKKPSSIYNILILTCFFSIVLAGKSFSLQLGNTEVTPEITISSEYDDNINLKNGIDDETTDDIVLHLIPVINFLIPYQDHKLSFDFDSDFRKGTKTDLSENNLNLAGALDLNFPGGLKFNFHDSFTKTRFDQALEDEAGISKNKSNTYGIATSFTYVSRLKAEGEFNRTWEEFLDKEEISERNTDTFKGTLSLPVTESIVSFMSYFYEKQDSEQNKDRNYKDNRYIIGAKWAGVYRFSIIAEGGYETIDYELSSAEDFNNPVGTMTLIVQITDMMGGKFSVGKDGYGDYRYEGGLSYEQPDDISANLAFIKETISSLSSTSSGSTLESTTYNLQLIKKLVEKITMTFEGSYQLQASSSDGEDIEDKIWLGKVSFDYPIQEWLKVGTHYQYAMREASDIKGEYTNNRVGMFATLTF
ncbi:MAG: hypothetical protein Q7U10_00180 [Thermodesulfovibrionia bacterium]|nr:hypothetical protein [Thermodesulfovibrionia bacterium]